MARIFTKDSSFIMPTDPATPFVMCGPGTGVVPFLGFIQEREIQKTGLGEAILYFGCRERDSDFIYRDEMAAAADKKIISALHIALSREKNEKKTYVQNMIEKDSEKVKEILLERNGQFFICGSTSMGKDVNNLLRKICGEAKFEELRKNGKLIQELW